MGNGSKLRTAFVAGYRPWIWICLVLYVCVGIIPAYWEMMVTVPDDTELQRSEGQLQVNKRGKAGYQFSLTHRGTTIDLTCRSALGMSHDSCGFVWNQRHARDASVERESDVTQGVGEKALSVRAHVARVEGETARVWWFEQPIYPFVTQRRIIRLTVAGEEWINGEATRRWIARSASEAPWWMVSWLVLFVLMAAFMELLTRRLKHAKTDG